MSLLTYQSPAWEKAHQMAANLQNLKDKRARRQQKVLLCEAWKKALTKGVK